MGGIALIYITGDMHADLKRFDKISLRKRDTLIVCGDFGFLWDGGEKEEKILKKIGSKRFKTFFIDGTHENFDLLENYETTLFKNAKIKNIYKNLNYIKRGQVIEIENRKIFCFGGGESTDREMRKDSNKWWKEEMPSAEDLKSAIESLKFFNGKVDYMVTHEPPEFIKMLIIAENESMENSTVNMLNKFFADLAKNTGYKKWYFGSMHLNKAVPPKYVALFNRVIKAD